jgi:hypothetical protein
MKAIGTLFIVLLTSVLGRRAVASQNLLENGNFGDHLAAWSRLDIVSWSLAGAEAPGSAKILHSNRPQGGEALIQCVPVEGWRLYDLTAMAFLPRGLGASGGVSVRAQFHAMENCQGPALRGAPSLDFSLREPAGWQKLELRRIPAPAETVSAMVFVIPHSAGPENYTFLIDDISLARSVDVEDVYIPAAASARGANGETFETDLWVHNPAPAERMFSLTFRCDTCGLNPTPTVLRVGPRQTRYFENVLGTALGQRERTGAIHLRYELREGPMLFSARVVTVHPENPGNGTAIPALPRQAARTSAVFPGLSFEEDPAAPGSRINAGAFNPNPSAVEMRLELVSRDRQILGTLTRTLEPGGWLQINDVVREAEVTGSSIAGAYLRFSSRIPVFPFVIAVDNRSGDGTWIAPEDVPVIP